MPETDNPAGRLHALLTAAKKHDTNQNGLFIWGQVFGYRVDFSKEALSAEVEIEVTQKILQTRQLVEEAEAAIRAIEGPNQEIFLRPFPRIREAFRINIIGKASYRGLLNHISEGDMTVLEICSGELSRLHAEDVIEQGQLEQLLEDINALFDQIQQSSLPDILRIFLLDLLESMRRAIQEYRIRGARRLKEELEKIVGALVVNGSEIEKAKDAEEVSRFAQVFSAFVAMVTFANKATPLFGPVVRVINYLLPSGMPKPPPEQE